MQTVSSTPLRASHTLERRLRLEESDVIQGSTLNVNLPLLCTSIRYRAGC